MPITRDKLGRFSGGGGRTGRKQAMTTSKLGDKLQSKISTNYKIGRGRIDTDKSGAKISIYKAANTLVKAAKMSAAYDIAKGRFK